MTGVMPAAQASAARMCASCPKMCRSACPTLAVTRNERHQPWGHARQIVAAMRDGAGFAAAALVDGVYACATCSACTPPCHVDGVATPELVWAARAAVHRAGATPAAGVDAVRRAREGMVPSDDSGMWTDPAATLDRLRAMATPGAALVLFPGCGALGRRPQAVLAAGRALRALDVPFDVPAEHRCCGMPALAFGDTAAMGEMLDSALASLHPAMPTVAAPAHGAAGSRSVAVQSPSCSWMLGVRARQAGRVVPDVEPLAATLARALAERSLSTAAGNPRTVAYHDPCYLARHQPCRDEPRAALHATGHVVAELRGHGDTTQCSGQGGGLPRTHPDIAAGYLELLTAQVAQAGVDEVVTGCASCAAALDGAGVRALELAEAVAAALGAEEERPR